MRRRIVSWFSVLLLTFNVFASVAQPSRPISLLNDGSANLLAQAMEICYSHPGEQQTSDAPASHDDHGLHCVFCLPLLQGGLALPESAVIANNATPATERLVFGVEQQYVAPARLSSSASPRAPPLA
jgi:hypothetical protein